ncbi:MAG: hypothetical protein JWM11_1763 [Planctomycetaceae bacterium]|nr:hypothetical protein [Planctomycetaceae bacterium]
MNKFATSAAAMAFSLLLAANAASAQDVTTYPQIPGRTYNWAEQMFDRMSHDFQVVARGAEVVLRIKVTNKYQETIHLSGARTSCNCISAKLSTNVLKTWEEGIVEVRLNTLQYKGDRNANVIVQIDQPKFIEVVIPIKAYIRTDVVLEPGSAIMGPVVQGDTADRKLRIDYAGNVSTGGQNWKITDVKSTRNPNVVCSVKELSRTSDGITANVSYELTVKLNPQTPLGDLREQITVITNDGSSPQIPVLVEGKVIPEYSVTPQSIVLKSLKPGSQERVKVVISSRKPFAVDKIESNSGSESFMIQPIPKDSFRVVQELRLIINAPEAAGPFNEVFTVTLAGQGKDQKKAIEFKLSGKVLEGGVPKSEKDSVKPQQITTAKPVVQVP